jgi:SAM-dependent methyltransferase
VPDSYTHGRQSRVWTALAPDHGTAVPIVSIAVVDLAERGDTDRRHPWETERARFFRGLIARHLGGWRPRRILDVGAGDGWFAGELGTDLSGCEIVCWDVNYRSEELDVPLPEGIVRTAVEPEGTFDLVLLLDVIEHVADDAAFLDSIVPHLAERSLLVVSVPAYQRLFSSHDDALAHHRRYSPRQLHDLLAPRFEVVARGGLFASLLPLRAAAVARERVAGPPDEHGIGGWSAGVALTRAVSAVLAADAGAGAWLAAHGVSTPGLSTWAVCQPRASAPRARTTAQGAATPGSCTVVVPCFNEADRLDPAQIRTLIETAGVHVLAVDDGSTDGTADMLDKLAAPDPERMSVLSLGANRGKGEAVRQGLLGAIASGADIVAYCDADFATPPEEVARLVAVMRADDGIDVVLASRVAMLGSDIRRSAFRHYSGRVFATASSLVLGVPVYDTQCGAKVLRVTQALRRALEAPFVSRWVFDVELLGRLLRDRDPSEPVGPTDAGADRGRFVEVPLARWSEPGGSKLTLVSRLRAATDLARIERELRRIDRGSYEPAAPEPRSGNGPASSRPGLGPKARAGDTRGC